MSRIFCSIFFPFSFGWSVAQVSVKAELDSTSMLIGDQVQLHIQVKHKDKDVTILQADISAIQQVEKLEILDVSEWDTLSIEPDYLLEQNLTLTSFDSGYYWIPSFPIAYTYQGQTRTAYTNELPLEVQTMPEDTLSLAPIKPIIEEPIKIVDFIPYAGGLFALIAAVLLAYFLIKRKKPKEKPPKVIIQIPVHEQALNRLDALRKEKLWQQGEIKKYHSELTHIIREYLENRFELNALESTSDDIIKDFQALNLHDEWNEKLKEMLTLADLVKFAKAEPLVEVHDTMMDFAEKFILQTKKIEIPEEEINDTEHSDI